MSAALVLYAHRPPAAVLTLNRPDKRSALSRALIAALSEAFQRAKDDPAARCVLLTGAGPAFCAGMDLTELSETIDADREVIWDDALSLGLLFDLIYHYALRRTEACLLQLGDFDLRKNARPPPPIATSTTRTRTIAINSPDQPSNHSR